MRCSKSIVVVKMNECVLKTWQCPQLDDSFTRIGMLWTADVSLVLRGPFISIFGIDLAQLFDIWSHRNLIAAGPLHAKWDRLGSVMLAPGFDWAKAKHSVATVMRGRVQ